MKCISAVLFITIFGGTWRLGRPTCVLESDFGFTINCALKKSGLFRIRNLGGVKAHIGLGFSLGDELGFKESLSNVESNRRRSAESAFQPPNNQKLANTIKERSPALNAQVALDGTKKTIVPPFKPIPPALERPSLTENSKIAPAVTGIAPIINTHSRISTAVEPKTPPKVMTLMVPINKVAPEKFSSTNFALRTLASPNNEVLPSLPHSNALQAILAANNVTEETLQAALVQREHALLARTTTTTPKPKSLVKNKYTAGAGKVMNAPKEYYPVGYDKNFDDNFASRVELPETSFYCGNQKHFPGLYADEDLGCMVFHVCALTDDGLIMKSFLCPESTLFDQTILKCNWWFYVDCKHSKSLYDSNIPISKSYQLMKALTFFSGYKKESASTVKAKDKD